MPAEHRSPEINSANDRRESECRAEGVPRPITRSTALPRSSTRGAPSPLTTRHRRGRALSVELAGRQGSVSEVRSSHLATRGQEVSRTAPRSCRSRRLLTPVRSVPCRWSASGSTSVAGTGQPVLLGMRYGSRPSKQMTGDSTTWAEPTVRTRRLPRSSECRPTSGTPQPKQ